VLKGGGNVFKSGRGIKIERAWSAVLYQEMTKIWSSILSKTADHALSIFITSLIVSNSLQKGFNWLVVGWNQRDDK